MSARPKEQQIRDSVAAAAAMNKGRRIEEIDIIFHQGAKKKSRSRSRKSNRPKTAKSCKKRSMKWNVSTRRCNKK